MLEKKYNHMIVEEGKYSLWKEKRYFDSGDKDKEPFTIVIPPPNITGKLHLGHAWDTAIQDTIIRFKRMQGYDALWLPGMDHAAISTEAKVVAKLQSEGVDKKRIGRENFIKECWDWKNKYSNNIRDQWAKLGLSLDYRKERFTLDEGLNNAVNKVFVDLYNKGLIYRGEKIINWDPVAQTALSNEEVIYKNDKGAFYHIKYFIEGTNEYLDVATTRPETLFGDTAVAVNPNDKRYKKYIGKKAILPIINKLIPIIADAHADPEFGSGVVKITPAHDPNDFEVGLRHNLEKVVCINPDATMNENADKYNNQDRYECRENLIEDLKSMELLIEIEHMVHSVGHSERTDAVVEPYLSKQWFVKMKPLADAVLENQKNSETKINFIPKRFEKTMNHWMEIINDWCISRQLWWGHRIPAWYKDNEIYVGLEAPKEDGWAQDEDVLDTWFSSALWPFSTLGWPDETSDMKKYFPTDVLVTGYDIIFFWVCRMAFDSLEFTKQRPFKHCLIHGLVRDINGKKMSKSLGNGIDPMDEIDEYGADSLRFYLNTAVSAGIDLKYDRNKLKSSWNFLNKLWNASRYVLMNLDNYKKEDFTLENLSLSDKWILTKMNKTIKDVTKHMEKFDLNMAGNTLYEFIWHDYCDNYIEMSKFATNNTTSSVLLLVLTNILKMMSPYTPFITEEIYNMLPIKECDSIMISSYPVYDKKLVFKEEEIQMDKMLDFISLFRNIKTENKISSKFEIIDYNNNDLLNKIINISDKIVEKPSYNDSISVELYSYKLDIYFDNKENYLEQQKKLEEETNNLKLSIERRKKLLSNENYVNKAPKEIVNKEKEDLEKEILRLETLMKN
ncbi:MAG: valine--tRNA ligase [Tenericutes bacterium]|nr:valine--tRNA ligase [Mycoplasmatota bacterium]